MNVEVVLHDSGELLPILLDDEGMPIPLLILDTIVDSTSL
ncbi:hypothetical protein ACBE110449_14980 [Acinetobacter bereziniae]|uniref:Uncharacterized protein n=1 Tax=Acinetobacter bereziniae NIPH 3 TaxID=1217651 RepID=N8YKC4_ACIBZ|nr:hypothetical protein F963_04368 [Acinetobacter bereziniae NIPH 3]